MMDFDIGLGLIVSRRLLGPDSGMDSTECQSSCF